MSGCVPRTAADQTCAQLAATTAKYRFLLQQQSLMVCTKQCVLKGKLALQNSNYSLAQELVKARLTLIDCLRVEKETHIYNIHINNERLLDVIIGANIMTKRMIIHEIG